MLPSVVRFTFLGAIVSTFASMAVTRGENKVSVDVAFPKTLPPEAVQVLGSSTLRSYHVERLAFSSDGKRLAAARGDEVQLWDATTGKQIAVQRRPNDRDVSTGPLFRFVDDNRLLIHGDSVTKIAFWNLATFESEPRVIRDIVQGFAETPLAASVDGARVVLTRSASRGESRKMIVVRSSPQGKAVFEQYVFENAGAALSADGKRVAYFSSNQARVAKQVFLRDIDDDVNFPPLGPFERGADAAFFSPDGRTLFVVDQNVEVTAWDVETGKKLRTLYPPARWGVSFVANLSSDGRRIVVTAHGGGVVVIDTATGAAIRRFHKHPHKFVRAVALSADGSLLAFGGEQNVVEIWNVDQGTRHIDPVGHYEHIHAVAVAPDAHSVAMIDPDRLLLWNRRGEITAGLDTSNMVLGNTYKGLNFTPDGRSVVTVLNHGQIEFRDATTLSTQFTVQRRQPFPILSAMSPGLHASACLLSGNAVKVQPGPYAVEGRQRPNYETFAGPTSPIVRLEFSFDGLWLAANDDDGQVLVWSTTRRNQSFSWETKAPVGCLAVSGVAGQYVATGGSDRVVRLWEGASWGKELRKWVGTATPTALAFDVASTRLAAGYDDGSVRLLRLEGNDAETIVEPRKGGTAVSRLGWSPDGKRLGIGLADDQFRVWPDAVDFAETAMEHSGPVTFIGWLPDERISVGHLDGAVVFDSDLRRSVRLSAGKKGYAVGIGIRPQTGRLLYYRNDGEIFEHSGDTGDGPAPNLRRFSELHFHDEIACSALSRDGRTFVATTPTALLIWNNPAGRQTAEYPLSDAWQHQIEFLRSSQSLAVRDRGLSIRRVSDGQEIAHIAEPNNEQHFKYHCSPTEDVVAMEIDRRLQLHDVGKRRAVRGIELPFGSSWEFAFTPDGAQLVALGWDQENVGELIVAEVASRQVLHRLKLTNRWPREFSLLDGWRSAVVASGDGLGIIWTLGPRDIVSKDPPAEQLEVWWRDLAGDNSEKAYSAIWQLTEAGEEAAKFLIRRLPTTPPNNEPLMLRVGGMIAGLSGDATAQQEAIRRLTAMRPYVDDELHGLLGTNLPSTVKTQIEAVLSSKVDDPSATELRLCRAAQILGRIGGDAARERLKLMQNGLPELPSTAAAKRAMAYLELSVSGKP